ncbi:MAG: hypothetical protein ABI035_01365 [Gemmatimonadaceae bacterium]
MISPLENLAGPGKPLRQEPFDEEEYAGLIHSGQVRLTDAQSPANSLESRFDLASNAAHALSLAALRYCGYRPANRYVVFQALQHTLGLGPSVWRVLTKCHDVRNRGEYEGDLDVDERLVTDLTTACKTVANALAQTTSALRTSTDASRESRCPAVVRRTARIDVCNVRCAP